VPISANDRDTLPPLMHCLQELLGETVPEAQRVSGTAAMVEP
jgi:hypothetical protein